MRQVLALHDKAQKRVFDNIKIKAKLIGVELKQKDEEDERVDIDEALEAKLEKAREEALARIRKERSGKNNLRD